MLTRLADRSSWESAGLAVGLVLVAANVASALEIHIGGIDVETQYTGFVGSVAGCGRLTFDDAENGSTLPPPGLVTTSDLAALLGADVDFEVALDTSGSIQPRETCATPVHRDGTRPRNLHDQRQHHLLLSTWTSSRSRRQPIPGAPLGRPDGRSCSATRNRPPRGGFEPHGRGGTLNAGRRSRHIRGDGAADVEPEPGDDEGPPGLGLLNLNFTNGSAPRREHHLEHHHHPGAEHGGAAGLLVAGDPGRGPS